MDISQVTAWVALFRGINVGGNNMLPMKPLATILESAGFSGVRTYIQSGNVVFRSERATASSLAKRIAALVRKHHGFEPKLIVLSAKELEQAVAANPFSKAEAEPKSLHLFFLAEAPRKPDIKSLERLQTATETFVLKGKVFYLHAPDGIGTSKLASRAERLIGVDATARNWRTVTTLLDMSRGAD